MRFPCNRIILINFVRLFSIEKYEIRIRSDVQGAKTRVPSNSICPIILPCQARSCAKEQRKFLLELLDVILNNFNLCKHKVSIFAFYMMNQQQLPSLVELIILTQSPYPGNSTDRLQFSCVNSDYQFLLS